VNAPNEARWLVQEASGLHGSEWADGAHAPAAALAVAHVQRMLERRLAGEPLQYVLGSWSFRAIDLFVDRRVLIPRPETEQVVDVVLGEVDRIRAEEHATGSPRHVSVVDLGTGSGAIALSVAAEREWTDVWATDASADALDVARANLAGIGRVGTRVALLDGSWFDALPADLRGTVDVVASNPPYVSEAEYALLDAEVRDWEPREALVPGPSGLEAIEQIVRDAPAWLAPRGALVLEIGETQGAATIELALDAGFSDVQVVADLAGRDRIFLARP
jgi:release factor glutamine methyltransferase